MKSLWSLVAAAVVTGAVVPAQAELLITEFMSLNTRTLRDVDGQYSDWIEIYNTGPGAVNLGGWHLTDKSDDLTRWTFPSTNLAANAYIVVFASNKNRAVAGGELHTDFALSGDGEYLALTRPDGTVAFAYSPTFPKQNSDVSYGLSTSGVSTNLISAGNNARILVPTAGTAANWNQTAFNDASWDSVPTGIGYDTGTAYDELIATDVALRLSGINSSMYLRQSFNVVTPSDLKELKLRMIYDDGFVAYLNGQEVLRRNAPTTPAWNSTATAIHGPPLPGVLTQNFENASTAYTLSQFGNAPAPAVLDANAGSTGKFARLMNDGAGDQNNAITFNQTAPGQFGVINATFDFRVTSVDDPADGFAFMLIPTSSYGTNGVGVNTTGRDIEEPNIADVFAVGFDLYPHGSQNDISIHWDGTEFLNVTVPHNLVDLASGQFHRINVKVRHANEGAYVTITLTPNINGAAGAPITVMSDHYVFGLDPYDSRVQFAGRTGGSNMDVDLDNLNIQFQPSEDAVAHEEFDITSHLGKIVTGQNVLAVQGLNITANDNDFIISPELIGRNVSVRPEDARFFSLPTPGRANESGADSVLAPPQFSLPGGVYRTNVQIAITSSSSSAVIRYTINGTEPITTSPIYTGPVNLTSSTLVRARAFATNAIASEITAQSYTVLGNDLTNFTSNLPLIVINPYGTTIVPDTKRPVYMSIIDTVGGRAALAGKPQYNGRAGIEHRGSSSLGFPKKSMGFELNDEKNEAVDVDLLGLPAESDWILFSAYNDRTLMRDVMAYELSNAMGQYAPRIRYVELFVNTGDGRLTMADYEGVYVLVEKIKRDANRVDIAKIETSDSTEPNVSGGYIFKKDRLDPGDSGFSTSSGQVLGWVEPKEQEVTTAQRAWVQNFFSQFETALYGANFRDPVNGYAKYIDVDAFIDHHIMVELCKNIDGYRLSTFMYKDRGGKLKMGPIWDYNLSLGNADYNEGWMTSGWYWSLLGDGEYPWYRRLFQDPDFQQRYIDRWSAFRRNQFNPDGVIARTDRIANLLGESQVRNFQRWQIMGQYVWPNWFIGNTYEEEVTWMQGWIRGRIDWIDSNWTKPPVFSRVGGVITPGTQLTITAPAGSIYYTLNGTDPRLSGGGLNPAAILYNGSITMNSNVRVFARARVGANWSGNTVETYVTTTPTLVITELMYNPAPPATGSPYVAQDFEYIELKNIGTMPINLSNYKLTNGVDYIFPNVTLGVGLNILVVKNRAAFEARYGNTLNIAGVFTGSLNNMGEQVALVGPLNEPILDFEYGGSWYPTADGLGFSLVIINPLAPLDSWNYKSSWRASGALGGSPGNDEAAPTVKPIWVNEVLTHTDLPDVDFIELYNPNSTSVDISGWYLSDSRGTPKKFRIVDNTVLQANTYRVFTENDFNANPGVPPNFTLSSHGEEVYLFSADTAGNLTGYSDGFDFGDAQNGITFGRYVNSIGEVQYPPQLAATSGQTNAGPKIGPVVINEINYAPRAGEDEFIELKNISGQPVRLYHVQHFTNTWRLSGVDFTFPQNIEIPANGLVVISPLEPAAFRTKYAVPANVGIFGPWNGNLQDGGERVAIEWPDTPDLETNGLQVVEIVPYIDMDVVRYDQLAPWPTEASGTGSSIERKVSTAYGNDPQNWRASPGSPSPGLQNDGNRLPLVEAGANQSIVAEVYPLLVNLTGTAIDDNMPNPPGRLSVSWSRLTGNTNLFFTNPSNAVTQVGLPGPGTYTLRLTANDGELEVADDVTITVTRPGSDASFIPVASTWRYLDNGSNQGTNWVTRTFNDASWSTGIGQFGYGDGDEATVISFGPNSGAKYITTYFRHKFTVSNPAAVIAMTSRLLRDDGAVLYLNGKEVYRSNMPDGTISNTTTAPGAVSGNDENTFFDADVDHTLLVAGENVLAVEIHQSSADSSDLSFELELVGKVSNIDAPPVVEAGTNQTVSLTAGVQLTGTVTDDGLPSSPGFVTIGWSKVSGPGTVTFASAQNPTSHAVFSVAGNYQLRLQAFDGVTTVSDTVTITVTGGDAYAEWKSEHFTAQELNNPAISGDDADPDGDTVTNEAEFISGTDPRDGDSYLQVDGVVQAGGGSGMVIRFTAMPGKTYTVQYRDSLGSGTWQKLGDVAAQPQVHTAEVPDNNATSSRYYRIVTPQQP